MKTVWENFFFRVPQKEWVDRHWGECWNNGDRRVPFVCLFLLDRNLIHSLVMIFAHLLQLRCAGFHMKKLLKYREYSSNFWFGTEKLISKHILISKCAVLYLHFVMTKHFISNFSNSVCKNYSLFILKTWG